MDSPEFNHLPRVDDKSWIQRESFRAVHNAIGEGRFLLRDERIEDYGVDFSLEVVVNGRATNYRAQVQLKGTRKPTSNADGTLTRTVSISSFHYLLNQPLSFYILHDQTTDRLLYAWAPDEAKRIGQSQPEWHERDTVTVHFSRDFRSELDLIANRILDEGRAIKEVSEQLPLVDLPKLISSVGASPLADIDLDDDPRGLRKASAELVLAALDKDDVDVAVKNIRTLLQDESLEQKDRAFLLSLEGRVLRWIGKLEESLESFRAAQKLDPAIKLRANEALALIDLDRLEEADQLMEAVMRTKPTAYALAVFQSLRKRQGRGKEALQAVSEFQVEPTPDTTFDFEMQTAETFLLNERTEDGLTLLRKLGGMDDSRPAAKFELAAYLTYYGHATGNKDLLKEAWDLLDVVTRDLRPNRYTTPRDYNEILRAIPQVRAQLLMELGRISEAISILEQAVERSPANDTKSLLVMMYAVAGRHADAENLVHQIEESGGSDETQYLYFAAIYKLKNGAALDAIGPILERLDELDAGKWARPFLEAAWATIHEQDEKAATLLEPLALSEGVPVRQRSLALGNAIAAYIRAHAFDKAMKIASQVTESLRAKHVLDNTAVAAGWRNAELSSADTLDQLKEHNRQAAELLEFSLRSRDRFHEEEFLPVAREYLRYAKASYGVAGAIERVVALINGGSGYAPELNKALGDLAADRDSGWPRIVYGVPDERRILGLGEKDSPAL